MNTEPHPGDAGDYHYGYAPFNERSQTVVDLVPNAIYLLHTQPADRGIPVTLHQLPSGRYVFYGTLIAPSASLLGWASTPTWRTVLVLRQPDGVLIEQPASLDFDLIERVMPDSSRYPVIRAAASRPPFEAAFASWLEVAR